MIRWLYHWLPVLLWGLLIILTSADSNPYQQLPAESTSPVINTALKSRSRNSWIGRCSHVGEYAIIAALLYRAMSWQQNLSGKSFSWALGLAGLFALSDEIHQEYVPVRAFELSDLALDIIGALIGLALYALLRSLRGRKSTTAHSPAG